MNSLLPPGSTSLERRLAQTCSGISDLQVPLRDLWNPATCPVSFLPYLARAFSVDRWDEGWTESVKRLVVKDAFIFISIKELPVPCGGWWNRSDS